MIIPPNSTDFDFPDLFNAHQEEGGSLCNRFTNWVASFVATPTQPDLNHELDNNIEQVEILPMQEEDRFEIGSLSEALRKRNFEAVDVLLDHGAIPSVGDLTNAIWPSRIPIELFRRLVQRAEDMNGKDWADTTPLTVALDVPNFEAIENLLDHGAISSKNNFFQAIFRNTPTELFHRFVQRVEDVNEKDKFGRSSLYVALHSQNFEAANILLDHGAISNATDLVRAINSDTPTELFHRFVRRVEDVNEKDEFGRSPLDKALVYSKFEAIKALLENGADLSLVDPSIHPSHEIASIVEFYRTSQEFVRNLNGVLRRFIFEEPE